MIIDIIRHGEEPDKHVKGYTDATLAHTDKESLSAAGWDRAKNKVTQFSVTNIYCVTGGSRRAAETVSYLSTASGIPVVKIQEGQEQDLVRTILGLTDNARILICWEHKKIAKIVKGLGHATPTPRSSWPKSDYGTSYQFTGGRVTRKWHYYEYTY